MTITITTDQARINWRDTIDKVYTDRDEIILQRYNKPVAVMLNYDIWQMLMRQRREYLERLAKEVENGEYFTQEQVEEGLRERGLL